MSYVEIGLALLLGYVCYRFRNQRLQKLLEQKRCEDQEKHRQFLEAHRRRDQHLRQLFKEKLASYGKEVVAANHIGLCKTEREELCMAVLLFLAETDVEGYMPGNQYVLISQRSELFVDLGALHTLFSCLQQCEHPKAAGVRMLAQKAHAVAVAYTEPQRRKCAPGVVVV